MSIEINWANLEEINKKMAAVSDNIARNAARAGVKAGAEIVMAQAIANARAIDDPDTPETIADQIAMTTSYNRVTGTAIARVGVKGGANYKKGDKESGKFTYFVFVEFGTAHSRARPFLRPAIESNQSEIFNAVVARMNAYLAKKITLL